MIVQPRIREFICTTAHPTGCAELVKRQVDRVAANRFGNVPRRIVVIGCSGGYGLATRIAATFAGDARVIGVSMERIPELDRTASAGWYSNRAIEQLATQAGRYARTIEGDAFSNEIKIEVAKAIREDFGKIDLLVYSLAAPSRRDPRTGHIHRAVVMPTSELRDVKSLDTDRGQVIKLDLAPASEANVADTIAVMGGADWKLWLNMLAAEQLLSKDFSTYHYTYIGSEATRPLYRDGTIGRAKADVERTAREINVWLGAGRARLVALRAAVTQASSAIPIMPLYSSLLRAVLAPSAGYEGTIDQIVRLFSTAPGDHEVDDAGCLRMDRAELDGGIQAEIGRRWNLVNTGNLAELADFPGYRAEQLGLFGFGVSGVDYARDIDPRTVTILTPARVHVSLPRAPQHSSLTASPYRHSHEWSAR